MIILNTTQTYNQVIRTIPGANDLSKLQMLFIQAESRIYKRVGAFIVFLAIIIFFLFVVFINDRFKFLHFDWKSVDYVTIFYCRKSLNSISASIFVLYL